MFEASVFVQSPGHDPRLVSPQGGLFYQASIHPEGHEVVFYGGRDGMPRIWRRILPDGLLAPITPSDSGARHPVYDWQGERLAFASDRGSSISGETVDEITSATIDANPGMHLNIYTAELDGSSVRQITDGPHLDHRPTFSPDGRWIAFASNRSGDTAIWRTPSDGSGPPEPVFLDHWGYRPWYTPGGTSILFYGPDGGRHRIWEVEIDTGLASPVESDDRGITHGPFMGSDDTAILVHSTRGGSWRIWELPRRGWNPCVDVTPHGFPMAAHATRSRNQVLAFDVKIDR